MRVPKNPATTNPSSDSDPFNVSYWSRRWIDSQTEWHKASYNPVLLKHISLVTGQNLTAEPLSDAERFEENGRKTWFLPLCGKTMDISYLLSQGFRVFAVEAVKMAIDSISEEQSISFEFDEVKKLYTGVGGRLQIYCGDFFTCPMEEYGPVDYVFDRGSFIAVEYEFREAYIETMKRILRRPDGKWHDFRYVLDSIKYDKSKFAGPPKAVDDDDLEKYFKSWSNVEVLESEEVSEGHPLRKKCGEGEIASRCFLMTPRKSESE